MLDFRYLAEHTYILLTIGSIFLHEYIQYMFGCTSMKTCYTNIINRSIKYNVLIVKIMQALTAKFEIHPEIHAVLTQNTHNVKYYEEELDQILLDNICKNYGLRLLDTKPFHSGMISVVYLGEINGEQVVIKMKRTNIESRIKNGSDNVIFIYDLLKFVFSYNTELISKLESLKSITKTQEYLIAQCDFNKEIDALITTKQEMTTYSICENIVIPKVYNTEEDIQTGDFIIMEFLEGKFASELIDDDDRKKYYKIFATFMAIHTFYSKYFHTDMHNGNILCMNCDGVYKIGIIDFGMNVAIQKDIQKALFSFSEIMYVTGLDNAKLHVHLNAFVTKPIDLSLLNHTQLSAIDKSMCFMAHHMQSGDLNEEHINQTYNELSNTLKNQSTIEWNMNFILMILGVSMANSTVRIMMRNDIKSIENTLKEIYFEMME